MDLREVWERMKVEKDTDSEAERLRGSLRPARPLFLWLGLALFGACLLMPAPTGMEPSAQRLLGVAALMACWWLGEVAPLAAVALLPLVLFPLLDVLPMEETAASYADQTVFLFLGGLLIAQASQRWGLHRRMAIHVLYLLGARPKSLVLGFMGATASVSMWVSNTATAVMMLPIGLSVILYVTGKRPEEIRQARGEERNFAVALMLGIAYGASIGGMATLVGTPPNLVLAGQLRKLFPGAPEIGFARWMAAALPLSLLFLAAAWFCLCWILFPLKRLGTGRGRKLLRKEREDLGSMSRGETWTLAAFLAAVVLWLTREPLPLGAFRFPGWSGLVPWGASVQDSTVAMAAALVLFLAPVDRNRGVYVLNWEWASKIPWDVLLLFGGGFALACAFRETGLTAWFAGRLQGLEGLPPVAMVLAVCLLITLLTELTSNTATTAVMLPVLAATALKIHVNPLVLMVPATLSASCAFMLPVGTPPNAVVFASGCIDVATMARAGLRLNLLGLILIPLFLFASGFDFLRVSTAVMPSWAVP